MFSELSIEEGGIMLEYNKLLVAISETPYYINHKDRYLNVDWQNIPVIDKEIVRKNNLLFCRTQGRNNPSKIIKSRTSGSTGVVLDVYWAYHDYINSLSKVWRVRCKNGVLPIDKYGTDHSYFYDGEYPISHKIVYNKNCISYSKINCDEDTLLSYLVNMKNNKIKWLMLQPTFAYQLSIIKKKYSIALPDLRFIELIGEMFSEEVRSNISNSFSVPIYNHYGMQEFNTIAYEDETGMLKCMDDNVYIEILDDQNIPCEEGKEGNIVVTTLTNTYMPLIRYVTYDRGIMICNNGERYLSVIKARASESVIEKNNYYDYSLFFWLTERINALGNSIYKFQYHLKDNDLHCILISTDTIPIEKIKQYIANILLERYSLVFSNIYISINENDIIENMGEKLNYFINFNDR